LKKSKNLRQNYFFKLIFGLVYLILLLLFIEWLDDKNKTSNFLFSQALSKKKMSRLYFYITKSARYQNLITKLCTDWQARMSSAILHLVAHWLNTKNVLKIFRPVQCSFYSDGENNYSFQIICGSIFPIGQRTTKDKISHLCQ
jgi:hypothetical protein